MLGLSVFQGRFELVHVVDQAVSRGNELLFVIRLQLLDHLVLVSQERNKFLFRLADDLGGNFGYLLGCLVLDLDFERLDILLELEELVVEFPQLKLGCAMEVLLELDRVVAFFPLQPEELVLQLLSRLEVLHLTLERTNLLQ